MCMRCEDWGRFCAWCPTTMQCGDLRKWDSHCPGDDSTLVRREILKDRAADEVKHERLLQKQRQQLLLRRQSGKGKVQTLLAYTPPGAAEALSQSRSGLFPFTPKWSAVVHGPMCDRYSDKAEKSCARHTTCFDCTGQNRGGGSDGCAGHAPAGRTAAGEAAASLFCLFSFSFSATRGVG